MTKKRSEFAEKLRSEQERIGVTQPQLAEILQVSPRAVWKWLNTSEEPMPLIQEGALMRLSKLESAKP